MPSQPYDLSVDHARTPLIIATSLSVVATITTIIRFSARFVQKSGFKWDDHLLLLSLVCGNIELVIYWICVLYGGLGRHITVVAMPDVTFLLKIFVPFEILYNISVTSIKCSVLAFYFRVFGVDRRFRLYAWIVTAIVLMWCVAGILQVFLMCRPFAYAWDFTIPGATCGNKNAAYIANAATNMVNDLLCLFLPIPTILKLQLPPPQKIGLLIIFGLGIFVTLISVFRLRTLIAIDFNDPTYTLVEGIMWSCLEDSIATINANLPILYPFFKAMFKVEPQITGSAKTSNTPSVTESKYPLTKKAQYVELHDLNKDVESGQHSRSGSVGTVSVGKDNKLKDGSTILVTREFDIKY